MNATQDRTNNTLSDIPRQTSSPRHSLKFPITPTSSSASLKSSTSSRASTSSGSSPLSSSTNQPEKSERAPNGRPLSHHRRKSSVSTRRESQEIITGVLVGEDEELPASREEIRKRALLALEGGRNVMSGFTRVEIPEWKTPSAENKTFDWDPASLGNLGNLGMNPLAGKRDSFGRSLAHASMSSKAELGTLVEEEEDEDDDHTGRLSGPKKLDVPVTQIITPTPPHKARPASLMLRQLSLVGDLPTPATTPSPRNSSSNAMRPLTLSPSLFSTPPSNSSTISNSHRSSVSSTMSFTPASPASPSPLGNGASPASAAARRQQSRLSYRRDSSGQSSPSSMDFHSSPLGGAQTQLRTPQSSISSSHLTHSSRLSQQSSIGGGGERPMTPTEAFAQQTFNMQAHATLLDRIAILEEALAKAQAQSAPGPVEEELIALVADLKSSRDQLHERASGAEAQILELERSAELAKKRLEGARQDAWAAKDRADLLQLQLDGQREELESLGADKARLELARSEWKKDRAELEARLESVMAERDVARAALEAANAKLAMAAAAVPVVKQRGITNMSASSAATTMFGDSDMAGSVADEAFENFRLPLTPGAASFKFKDQGEPPLSVLAEEEDEDDTNHGLHAPAVEASQPETEADPLLRASFAANFEDSYSDEDEDDNGLGEYEDEPTGFAAFMEATHSSNDELMDDFDDDNDLDDDEEDEDEDEDIEQNDDEMIKPSEQHARAPSTHNRRVSLVVNWRFPQGGAAPTLNPKRLSAVMHANPFFITEEEVDFDDVPRAALVTTGNTPKKPARKSQTRVEVTPELADSFNVNFVDEDDEGFSWGEPVAPAAAVPAPASKAVVEQKPKAMYKSPRSSDPLCPPADVMEKSLHKLASIVPLVPKEEDAKPAPAPAPAVTVAPPPMGSSKPKSRVMATGRPKVSPPPFIIPPPTFASASSPSPFIRATSPPPSSFKAPPPSSFPSSAFLAASASSEASSSSSFSSSITSSSAPSEDNSFSYSFFSSGNNTRARSGTLSPTGSGSAASSSALGTMHPNEDIENQYTPRNVVAFPTTSASPFTMRVLPASSLPSASSIGSTLASWVPSWGSSRASPAPATPTSPSKMARAMSPSIASVFAEDLQRPASPASSSSHSVHTMQVPSTPKTVRQQVSADVMRERLRARLMQEGKLKSPGSPGLSSSPSLRR